MDRRAFLLGFGAAIIVGTYFGWMTHARRKFPGFPGRYICDDFGVPTPAHKFLFVDASGAVEGAKELTGVRVPVGKLIIDNPRHAKIDFDMSAVHTPEFSLNPLIENALVPDHKDIRLVGSDHGQQQYSHHCVRK